MEQKCPKTPHLPYFYSKNNNFVMRFSKKVFILIIDEGRFHVEKILYF